MSSDELIELGHIQGAYGLKGWVKIYSHSTPKENIFLYKPWLIESENGWVSSRVIEGKPHGKTLVARLEGCDDRNAADALVGSKIAIKNDQLQQTEDDEFYWKDIIGCEVRNVKDESFGKVTTLYETGGYDVMAVQVGDNEYLIPFVPGVYVQKVDLDEGLITVDWERAYSE